jgi:hypothetical protein
MNPNAEKVETTERKEHPHHPLFKARERPLAISFPGFKREGVVGRIGPLGDLRRRDSRAG